MKCPQTYQQKAMPLTLFSLLFLGVFAITGTNVIFANSQDDTITDKDITIATESRFIVDKSVPVNAIDVSTKNGIVTLTGKVNTILAKDRATRITENIRGVRAIVNRMKVVPLVQKDDPAIVLDVEAALAKDPATDSYEVTVASHNGTVTLHGVVDSWQEKQLSAQVAKSVKGVKEISNQLKIRPAAIRRDSEIKAEIMRMLQADVFLDDQLIGVMIRNGHVTLTGVVGSLAEKNSAFTDAWVSGVISVNTEPLKVEWWAKDRMRREPGDVIRSNEGIKQAIELALSYDPRINQNSIEVDVKNGIVTLRGILRNAQSKSAAQMDAENTVGVFLVKNLIKVRPPEQLSDSELESQVRQALANNALVDRYDINVTGRHGQIFLDGYMDSVFEISQAVKTAEKVSGVVEVINQLIYTPHHQHKSDEALWQELRQAFWWDPHLYDQDIRVSIEDGHVTLTGTVPTVHASKKAIQISKDTGAKKVTSRLRIQHAPDFFPA
ncbi:BON domain-containing protein [Candidatus Nitronereus thalassa]|uniref:BON domain-containing protein n=1 Tax=Candidatus Nitronereus thalassa TaxID=3020898 RepID=A0ABU3KC21_9BACT|nr:BON domain-containing protein [Candidatus Nitronereus thalassa]MDT7043722.1 BON domain-containing protein [Candidatus Nitronereus thalassa]